MFLSCSLLSWSVSMCWWTCDFTPQIGPHQHVQAQLQPYRSFLTCSPLLLLLRHLLILVPLIFCPSPLLSRDWSFSSRSQSHPAHRPPATLAKELLDHPHRMANVKTRNIVGPHRMHLMLPLPTIPRSGLLKSWKVFWDVYRNIHFLLCTFSALFQLRLTCSPFFICPFWSRLYYCIHCDIPHPRSGCARHHAPHDNSVKFLVFRHRLFIAYDTMQFVTGRTFVLFILFPFSPSTYFCS